MARRADRKLNPDAVKAANAAVGNRQLHPTDPADAEARKQWMDAYEAAAGKQLEDSSSNNPQLDSPRQTCDPTWCEIRYKYADGSGVPNADYRVWAVDSVSGVQKVFKGKVDSSGFARVDGLPAGCAVVSCSFDNDPNDWEPFPSESPKPHGIKNLQLNWPKKEESLPGFEMSPTNGAFFFSQLPTTNAIIAPYVDAFAEWMKPVILGDWHEAEPSYGQLAVRTAIEMIPVVDQIADIRDLASAVKKLVIDERYDEFWVWFEFGTTLVGCIPGVGSALKGLLRAFGKVGGKWVGPTAEAVIRWMNKKGKGNAVKEIAQWSTELAGKIKGQVVELGTKILENGTKILEKLKSWATGAYDSLAKWATKKLQAIKKVIDNFTKKMDELFADLKNCLDDWLKNRKGKRETSHGKSSTHNTGKGQDGAPEVKQQRGDIGEGPRGLPVELKFGDNDLVYGPSAGDKLRNLQKEAGGKLLTDLEWPYGKTINDFTKGVLDEAATSGRKVHFDLTNMTEISDVLNGSGKYADTVTSVELRHIRDNWDKFKVKPTFYKNGVEVPPPW